MWAVHSYYISSSTTPGLRLQKVHISFNKPQQNYLATGLGLGTVIEMKILLISGVGL